MLKLLSLFSGIGAFEQALKNLEVEYELAGFCEIDKYATASYCAVHGVDASLNLGDITNVDVSTLPHGIDLLTYGFPCTDISLAGRQQGLYKDDGSLTRSGLFFEALRIIEATQPTIAIAENVKNLVSKKFAPQFATIIEALNAAGYNSYWQVLNAKDYGVPQNRERVFIVSIRKDLDNGQFTFPEPIPLSKRLKDVLEDNVDEKYYVSDERIRGMIRHLERHKAKGNGFNDPAVTDVSPCITTRTHANDTAPIGDPQILQIGNVCPTHTRENPNQGRVYDPIGIAPSLNCMSGGNREPMVEVTPPRKYAKQQRTAG